jgi:hypothetical protein
LDSLPLIEWQTNINGMLTRIPFIPPEEVETYFDSIDSRLSDCEQYLEEDAPMLLELAIWKSKIAEQVFDRNNGSLTVDILRMGCRVDSLLMVFIIVRNVFSYL